jgi:hypothetical protein
MGEIKMQELQTVLTAIDGIEGTLDSVVYDKAQGRLRVEWSTGLRRYDLLVVEGDASLKVYGGWYDAEQASYEGVLSDLAGWLS